MLQSMGFQIVGHDLVIEQQQQGKRVLFFALVIIYENGCQFPPILAGEQLQKEERDFPSGPVVKNAGDMGSIPCRELKSHMLWSI